MKLGASPTSLGVTARWKPECCGEHVTLWQGDNVLGSAIREDGVWHTHGLDGALTVTPPPVHRWQAKRAVEAAVSRAIREGVAVSPSAGPVHCGSEACARPLMIGSSLCDCVCYACADSETLGVYVHGARKAWAKKGWLGQ